MLSISVLSLIVHAAVPLNSFAFDDALTRFNTSFEGLQSYYWNESGGFWNCCGQTGGAGGARGFGCACEAADGHNCLNCYRWWFTQVLEVLLRVDRAGLGTAGVKTNAVVLAGRLLRQSPYNSAFARTMNFVFVDDYGWYVLAYLSAYELLGDQRYLAEAEDVYKYLWEVGWDQENGCGGFYWEAKSRRVKNAVTNLEMLQAAARLHLITGQDAYKDQAFSIWNWLAGLPLRDKDGLLGDGVTGDAAAQSDCCNGTAGGSYKERCVRNTDPSYTYNQGLFAGAAALLYRMTGKKAYAGDAIRTLQSVLSRMTVTGVLEEPAKRTHVAAAPPCHEGRDPANGDFYSFKGIFMLQLADFLHTVPLAESQKAQMLQLIVNSSNAAWESRVVPPWPESPQDSCADPLQKTITSGWPKFPWYWAKSHGNSSGPARVCLDARSHVSAMSAFAVHLITSKRAAAMRYI